MIVPDSKRNGKQKQLGSQWLMQQYNLIIFPRLNLRISLLINGAQQPTLTPNRLIGSLASWALRVTIISEYAVPQKVAVGQRNLTKTMGEKWWDALFLFIWFVQSAFSFRMWLSASCLTLEKRSRGPPACTKVLNNEGYANQTLSNMHQDPD